MFKNMFLSVGFLLVIFANGIQADEISVKYDKSNPPPDNVALRLFLRLSTRFDDAHKRHHRVLDILANISFEKYDDAQDFLDFLVQMNMEINNDRELHMRATLCSLEVPRPTGRRVYEVMNEQRDHYDARANYHLAQIRRELGPKRYEEFEDWLRTEKEGMTIVRTNYVDKYRNKDPDMVRQDICGRFDSKVSQ